LGQPNLAGFLHFLATRSAAKPDEPHRFDHCWSYRPRTVLAAIFLHVSATGTKAGDPSLFGFRLLLFLPGILLVVFLFARALRTGTAYWIYGTIERDDTPFLFWFYVVSLGLLSIRLLITLLW
jgi:hypothetical protein